jgi:hypothetical protein
VLILFQKNKKERRRKKSGEFWNKILFQNSFDVPHSSCSASFLRLVYIGIWQHIKPCCWSNAATWAASMAILTNQTNNKIGHFKSLEQTVIDVACNTFLMVHG